MASIRWMAGRRMTYKSRGSSVAAVRRDTCSLKAMSLSVFPDAIRSRISSWRGVKWVLMVIRLNLSRQAAGYPQGTETSTHRTEEKLLRTEEKLLRPAPIGGGERRRRTGRALEEARPRRGGHG